MPNVCMSLQAQGVPLMLAGQDLLIAVVNAVDGEKDPRCLMAAFSLSAHVAQLYVQHADQVGPQIAICCKD